MIRRPPRPTLFPYPPLSRSLEGAARQLAERPHHVDNQPALKGHARVDVLRVWPRHSLGDQREALGRPDDSRSEEHTSELQSQSNLVCRLLLEKKKVDEIPCA